MDVYAETQAYAQADFADVNQAFVERLLELTAHKDVVTAVDLGTGPADIPVRILRARPDWYIVAVDASEPMLHFARKRLLKEGLISSIELVLADAKATGLSSYFFDVVFSNSILHHLTDTDLFWAEVKRLAIPGAIVLLRDLARPATTGDARKIVQQYASGESELLQQEYYRSLLAAYTVEEVRAQLDEAGLQALQVAMVSDRHLDVFGRLD